MPYHRPIPDANPRSKTSAGMNAWVQAEKLMQIALILPCSAFIGWLLGAWADKALHQTWINLAGIVFGGISGLVYVVRLAIATSNKPEFDSQGGKGSTKGDGGPGNE